MKQKQRENELVLIPKYQTYMQYTIEMLIKIPRTEKFSIGTEYKQNMYKVKRFSMSNKAKLGLAAVSMPIIGSGIGYASGYHGPSKKETSHVKNLIDINKKRRKEARIALIKKIYKRK